ncbi:hypothetical protein CSA56_07645 [candidate division KSB3 bacterium]|uniref:GH3 middle domain-containing protein n=1 Tax=candidate division KSB3 bacterium TaxID=2044937 RepID=A0A2G6KFS4_9BACT|nr:MAG: hypothetical protein CSA56_07645 [candidate division KSB3 bacterium]
MAIIPYILQGAFALSQLPGSFTFSRLQQKYKDTQEQLLLKNLKRNQDSHFGREHGFKEIHDITSYRKRVPIRNYRAFLPYIENIRQGQQQILTAENVLLCHLTGGTTGTKLIPYTRSLKQEFQHALAPWLFDVFQHFPHIMQGKTYWTITPPGQKTHSEKDQLETGFEEDSSYFGWKGYFLQHLFAVPSWVAQTQDIEQFRLLTLYFLLRAKNLRWISIWSPTFLLVLLEELEQHVETLLASLHGGFPTFSIPDQFANFWKKRPAPQRTRELESVLSLPQQERYKQIWPHLSFISLWKDAYAHHPAQRLKTLFPDVYFQGKGLLATEGVMTIPLYEIAQEGFSSSIPAFTSHFLEFVSENESEVRCLWELEEGKIYSILLTTGGGLYRYDIGDVVRVEGFYHKLPVLRFLGRKGRFSDLVGEKLEETFVTEALKQTFATHPIAYSFLLLAPESWEQSQGYIVFLESSEPHIVLLKMAEALETALRRNFHYAFAVKMGQLSPVKIFLVDKYGQRDYVRRCLEAGQKLGDIKPLIFDTRTGWQHIFQGDIL